MFLVFEGCGVLGGAGWGIDVSGQQAADVSQKYNVFLLMIF